MASYAPADEPVANACNECGRRRATLSCPECGPLCATCDLHEHAKPKKIKHTRSAFHEPCEGSSCRQDAAVSCPDCGLLCAACDEAEHRRAARRAHVRSPWPPQGGAAAHLHARAAPHPAQDAAQLIAADRVTAYVEINRGHFGVVFKALYESGLVVVKVPLGSDDGAQLHEYNTLAKLQRHPNVLPLIGGIMVNNQVRLVSPFMPGGSLAQRMHDDPTWGHTDPARTLAAAIDMCDGLAALHAHDPPVVHRDRTFRRRREKAE